MERQPPTLPAHPVEDDDEEEEDLPERVDAAISRWWRSMATFERQSIKSGNGLNVSLSPKSMVWALARTKEGKLFLRGRVSRFSAQVGKRSPPHGRQQACDLLSLAWHLMWLSERSQDAVHYLEAALDIAEDTSVGSELLKAIRYCLARAKLQQDADDQRRYALDQSSSPSSLPEFQSVTTITVSELEENLSLWQQKGQPVLVKGLAKTMTSRPWSLEHIRSLAGDCDVDLMKPHRLSVQWAKLEGSRPVPVADFIDYVLDREAEGAASASVDDAVDACRAPSDLLPSKLEPSAKRPGAPRQSRQVNSDGYYFFDWSLPLNCPDLAAEVTLPPPLADNWLRTLPEGTQYHNSWPSLFIAQSGLGSGLHVDAFCSSFWMAVFQGTKQWTIFPRDETHLLYPVYPRSLDASFPMDISDWSGALAGSLLESYPALSYTHPWRVCAEAGDVLLVPWGCAHQVDNIGTTIAISSNVVAQHNGQQAVDWLQTQHLEDPHASGIIAELKTRLEAADFSSSNGS